MKLSYLIAKGRRTVLKISPPKNPRKFTGAVTRKDWSIRAARGNRIASALATAAADLVLPLAPAASDTCAAFWQYLPVPWDPELPAPMPAQVALSGAEGAGPGAGGRLVTAKAAENLVEWSSQS